jgi:two-component system sensor histidine kinase DesK
MSAISDARPLGQLSLTARQARWFLVAMHAPYVAFTATMVSTGLDLVPSDNGVVGLPLVFLAGALQLRHSLATSHGVRPRYWPLTLVILAVLAWVPNPAFGTRWFSMQWYFAASAAMLLPPRPGLVAVAGIAMAYNLWTDANGAAFAYAGLPSLIWSIGYLTTALLLGALGLFAAARLVRAVEDLRAARAELAELAVGRERLRIARDLHDLLGHTLSAVSLKGDLALRLLERNEQPRAVAEIESLSAVARAALHDMREVAQDAHRVSLASEAASASSLLATAGIETRLEVEVADAGPAVDELFGWALREGVTNVLRHSAAKSCAIRVRRAETRLVLTIENDGAPAAGGEGGHGLSGLAARAAAVCGTATSEWSPNGHYRLVVEVPAVVA